MPPAFDHVEPTAVGFVEEEFVVLVAVRSDDELSNDDCTALLLDGRSMFSGKEKKTD